MIVFSVKSCTCELYRNQKEEILYKNSSILIFFLCLNQLTFLIRCSSYVALFLFVYFLCKYNRKKKVKIIPLFYYLFCF